MYLHESLFILIFIVIEGTSRIVLAIRWATVPRAPCIFSRSSRSNIHCFKIFYKREARRRPGSLGFFIISASTSETLTLLLANNKCANQPAHPRSLISTFVIRYLKIKVRSDITKFSIFNIFFDRLQHDKVSGYAPGLGHDLLLCLPSMTFSRKLATVPCPPAAASSCGVR